MIGYIRWSIIIYEDNLEEQEAIRQLKKGDICGLEFLVARHQLKAVHAAYLITRDPGLAEDVVQDCFVRLVRSMRGFDEGRPFEPWFMRSVVNAAVKVMQRSARHVDTLTDADESLIADLAWGVEAQIESMELQNRIWDAMRKLSPRQRAVIVQRYFLEMSEKEMAAESGTAVGTIKWLLNAARKRLHDWLMEPEYK